MIWRDLNFLRLFFTSIISSFGDSAYFILLGWFVISITGSALALGTTLTAASIPRLIFMLVGGAAADRMSRKTILMASLLVRAAVLILFALMLLRSHGAFHAISAYVLAVVFGIVDAFYWPASGSILPMVVDSKNLPVANGFIQTSQQLSGVMGPIIASGLLFMKNYGLMFMSIAVLYIASTLVLMFLRLRETDADTNSYSAANSASADSPTSAWQSIVNGIRYTISIRILAWIMISSLLINLVFMGPINIGLPVLVKSMGWPGTVYGTFEAAIGVGAIAGGLMTTAMNGLRGHFRWLALFGVVMGIGLGLMGWIRTPWQGIAIMACMGITLALINIPVMTYIQTIVDYDKLGRVMSLLSFMSLGLVPVSYAISSLIVSQHWVSLKTLLFICGLITGAFWIVFEFIPTFRHMEEHPDWKNVQSS